MTPEEQFRQETGLFHLIESGNYRISYVDWLESRLTLAMSRIEAAEEEADLAVKIIEEFLDLDDNEYTSSETWVDFKNWFKLYQKRMSTIRAMEGK